MGTGIDAHGRDAGAERINMGMGRYRGSGWKINEPCGSPGRTTVDLKFKIKTLVLDDRVIFEYWKNGALVLVTDDLEYAELAYLSDLEEWSENGYQSEIN